MPRKPRRCGCVCKKHSRRGLTEQKKRCIMFSQNVSPQKAQKALREKELQKALDRKTKLRQAW